MPDTPDNPLSRLTHQTWFGPALLAGLFVVLLGGLLWLMRDQAMDSQRADLDHNGRAAQDAVRRRLLANQHYLNLLAQDMARDALTEKLFERRVSSYLLDHPELVSIAFVNPDGQVIWAAPRDVPGQDDLVGLRVTAPEPLEALHGARLTGQAVYSAPFDTVRGDTAFELHVPVYRGDTFVGTVAGACSLERLLRHAITRETFAKHRVSVVDGAGDAVVTFTLADPVDDRLSMTAELSPPGDGLALRLDRYGGGFWGWGVTLLTVLCVSLVSGMAWGMWALNRHIARRAEAETELRKARDELEDRVRERTVDLETEMHERQSAEQRLRQHQEQLTHVARVSTMGEMAAGLAHELHQPLGAITSFAEGGLMMIEGGLKDANELAEPLNEVSEQARRAGRILHRLREFVSEQPQEKSVASIGELTDEVGQLIDADARHSQIDLDIDLPGSLPPVLVDRIQVQQVLLNLMRNAIEAMQDTPADARRLSVSAKPNGGETVEVTVADTGPGCPPDEMGRVFDAFYTTKPTGMGMGLSISRTIVESHGGRLWVDSKNGQDGFTVHFTLPTAEARADHE